MSQDTQFLLATAADLLEELRAIEQAHNVGDMLEFDRRLHALDPVEIREAITDLRELRRQFGGGTIGRMDGSLPTATHRPRLVSTDEPSAPGFSVKVPCS